MKKNTITLAESQLRDAIQKTVCEYINNNIQENYMNTNNYVVSPMNYLGGKKKLLAQILPLFPKNINTFVDLFCGGATVGINVNCNKVIFNDINSQLISLYSSFKEEDLDKILSHIENRIGEFNLNKTNQDGYLALRNLYNSNPQSLDMFTLLAYSFNNQIRFNNKGQFNMPFGKNRSEFNPKMKEHLIDFTNALKNKNTEFTNYTFADFPIDQLGPNDFVYCDPPYLMSFATYNMIWNENEERKLLAFLNELNRRGIKFALSNVLENKNQTNMILINWIKENNFNVYHLNNNYSNCNYHRKEKESFSDEVLITNY